MVRHNLINHPRWNIVREIWRKILERDPTPQEFSMYSSLGTMALTGIANTIKENTDSINIENRLLQDSRSVPKRFGVSLVSTYNKQCGIATYTENLYRELKKTIPCCVISDDSRNRSEMSTEDGVIQCWSTARENSYTNIVREAIRARNSVVHIQHEYGLYTNNDLFRKMMVLLKQCGFKVVVTMHTVFSGAHFDYVMEPVDVLILHSEWAAQALHGRGVTNTTVIPHGTEKPMEFSREESRRFINELTGWSFDSSIKPEDIILGTSVGFISRNKLQVETLEAARFACESEPRLRFLLIGSTGRRSYDIDYLPKLKELENNQVKVVQKFLTNEEIAKVLIASDFSAMGYEQTEFSTSGAAHLAMTYGVPTITSNARILEDLDHSMSIKVAWADKIQLKNAMLSLCNDENLRSQLSNNALSAGIETYWNRTAQTHNLVYHSISEIQ